MKNLHLLSTDKPSRLFKNKESNLYSFRKIEDEPLNNNIQNQNIYITNDEEIKEGDYVTNGKYVSQAINEWWTKFYIGSPELKADYWKIILTTDQNLIKYGVQEIYDEFLEWFVKNPSCEEVEILIEKRTWKEINWVFYYKIIIPKEIDILELGQIIPKEEPKQTLRNTDHHKFKDFSVAKQETLEEALSKYIQFIKYPTLIDCAEFGAKWQERKAIEEIFEWLTTKNYLTDLKETLIKDFKQFKNK